MRAEFLHINPNSKDLILFFSGFGSEPSHFKHLDSAKNVLMVYDYTHISLDFSLEEIIAPYHTYTLIAWSMGVRVSSILCKTTAFDKKIAINGTNYGIHKSYGIHKALFKATIHNFNLDDFKKAAYQAESNYIFRSPNALRAELHTLYRFCEEVETNVDFTWESALLSLKDKIFPYSASRAFFMRNHTRIIPCKEPHFVFGGFGSWEEICLI